MTIGSTNSEEQRPYDIVLFGATGFVGRLTAEYLAEHAPEQLRWAVAGRNELRLKSLRDSLAELNPGGRAPGTVVADVADRGSLHELAASARVVATTVGPYVTYGQELVAACAELGTDYVDLTGESEFVDVSYVRHDARARETGARLVHACGFDSVPHDLGAYFTVKQLPEGVPLRVDGYVRADARFSGGTFASALTAFSRNRQAIEAARSRAAVEPRPEGRRAGAPTGSLRFVKEIAAWAMPLPTIDPRVVRTSARSLERYGPDFRYRHFAAVRYLPTVAGIAAAAGTAFAAAQFGPTRRRLSALLKPGEGPDAERRARSSFSVRFIGEGGGQRVYTEVAGGDPGYGETAKMLAESAMCLALDELPARGGQLTTAVAMGDALIERLQNAGITFRVAARR